MIDYEQVGHLLTARRRRSRDKKALLEKAKAFYAGFDFLDAYRLASPPRREMADAATPEAWPNARRESGPRLAAFMRSRDGLSPRSIRAGSLSRRSFSCALARASVLFQPIILPPPKRRSAASPRISGPRRTCPITAWRSRTSTPTSSTPPRTWRSPCFGARLSALFGLVTARVSIFRASSIRS